ncbi:universal stress protein [Candidatus Halobonum tyrrellensis]|uniref:universal stress protein n=1 Tax=Candidatus Halobonum tyrrellensis TaxID=1431545 RepID=UPI0006781C78|nr:universal stress protein [Candidatus Halobonum tyrrellensis]
MDVLAAVDGSDNSMRALRFAVEFADRFDGELDVVHVTDRETEATEEVLRRVDEVLASAGGEADFELDVVEGLELPTAREAGKELLSLVSDRGYDHVVVGHHGAGHIERAILGSASETVVRGTSVPVTVVP